MVEELALHEDRTVRRWVIGATVASILLTWLLASPDWMMRQVTKEGAYLESLIGYEKARNTVDAAIGVAHRIHRWGTGWLVAKHRAETRWVRERGATARWLITLLVLRMFCALWMLGIFFPLLIAAFIDGWARRAIAAESGEYPNAVRFNIGYYLWQLAWIVPLVLLGIPVAVPVGLFAIYWLLLAAGVYLLIRHLHPRV